MDGRYNVYYCIKNTYCLHQLTYYLIHQWIVYPDHFYLFFVNLHHETMTILLAQCCTPTPLTSLTEIVVRKRQTRKGENYLAPCAKCITSQLAHYFLSFQYTPHPPRLPCIFNQEAPLAEYFLHSLDNPLKRALGTLLLRETCEGQIRLAAAFQHREGFDGEGDGTDVEG